MQIAMLLAVLGVIGLFVLLVFLVFSSTKKEKARKNEMAWSLGFRPVEKPDQILTEQIFALHRHTQNPQFSLKNVVVRNTLEGQVYLYDLDDVSGDSTSVVANMGVAIVTPGRDLPRFIIFPRINMEGKLAAFANRAVEWLASRNMEKVVMDDFPPFDHRYLVTASDAFKVKEILNTDLINLLMHSEMMSVDLTERPINNGMVSVTADGEALSVSNTGLNSSGKKTTAEEIRARVDLALAISRALDQKQPVQS
jgi:hypothetical protein